MKEEPKTEEVTVKEQVQEEVKVDAASEPTGKKETPTVEEKVKLIGQKQFKVKSTEHELLLQEPDVTPLLKRLLNVVPLGEKITVTRVE